MQSFAGEITNFTADRNIPEATSWHGVQHSGHVQSIKSRAAVVFSDETQCRVLSCSLIWAHL